MRELKRGSYKFDRDARDRFLRMYEETGLMYKSARASGVSEETIRLYIRDNIEGFRDEFEYSRGLYRDSLEEEIHRRAVLGVSEPIIGGKDRDKIVTTVQKYSDRLLELHAKRHISEYRDKQSIDMNVRGGVMALPSPSQTSEDWEEQNKDLAAPKEVIKHLEAKKGEAEDQG